ncbi:MAG: hypothetical protein JWO45_264 [Spartobacteria bacterium]|nr:hypothetical protein [Spartobacteria bacterium]
MRSLSGSLLPVNQTAHMWNMSLVWWEFVLRGSIIYVFLILILRLTGKRQIGQMAPFDLVLLLVLSNAVQNSMTGGDNSVIGGMIVAATLVGLNWLVGNLTYKSKRAEALIEGRPELLIHDGKLFEKVLDKCKLTRHELMSALREAGCARIEDVRAAMLENDGSVSVIPKTK